MRRGPADAIVAGVRRSGISCRPLHRMLLEPFDRIVELVLDYLALAALRKTG